MCSEGFRPRLRRPASSSAHRLLSSHRSHVVAATCYVAVVAPARMPNDTGPNHVVTGSGPLPYSACIITELSSGSTTSNPRARHTHDGQHV